MIKSSHEINLEIFKKEILLNIPKCLDKLHLDSSINMKLEEINGHINDWNVNFPKLKSKWMLVNNQLYFIFNIQLDWQFLDIYWFEYCDGNTIKKTSTKTLNTSCYELLK